MSCKLHLLFLFIDIKTFHARLGIPGAVGAVPSFQHNRLQTFAGNNFEQSLPIHHDPTYIQHNSAPGQPMFMASQEMTNPPGAYQSFPT